MNTMHQRALYAALAAAIFNGASGAAKLLSRSPPAGGLPRRHRSTNKFTPHQGAQECERRRARGW